MYIIRLIVKRFDFFSVFEREKEIHMEFGSLEEYTNFGYDF